MAIPGSLVDRELFGRTWREAILTGRENHSPSTRGTTLFESDVQAEFFANERRLSQTTETKVPDDLWNVTHDSSGRNSYDRTRYGALSANHGFNDSTSPPAWREQSYSFRIDSPDCPFDQINSITTGSNVFTQLASAPVAAPFGLGIVACFQGELCAEHPSAIILPGVRPTERPADFIDSRYVGVAPTCTYWVDYAHAAATVVQYGPYYVYNTIIMFSDDQAGSRIIQEIIETASEDLLERIVSEVQFDALRLMESAFGNYVIQKLFERGTPQQISVLVSEMRGRMAHLAMQAYGCRVVQKAFDHLQDDQIYDLMMELGPDLPRITFHQHGNYVIQKAFEVLPSRITCLILHRLRGHIARAAKQRHGYRVVQKMLEHVPEPLKRFIFAELNYEIPALIVDEFGNYVVQDMIRKGESYDRARIILMIQQDLTKYASHKFGSYVVEAAIGYNAGRPLIKQLLTAITVNASKQFISMRKLQAGVNSCRNLLGNANLTNFD